MSRAQRILLVALLALGALALALWWDRHFERVEHEVELPPRGMARYNPLFALQRTLEALGHPVEARPQLDLPAMDLRPGELVVLASDVRTLSDAQAAALLDWVGQGGRLLFAAPATASGDDGALLARLGLARIDSPDCVPWGDADGAEATPAPLCEGRRLAAGEAAGSQYREALGDPAAGYALLSADYGEGRWSAVGSLEFLQRKQLAAPRHAALAWHLLAPLLEAPRVHLVYAVEMEALPLLLWRHGWRLLLPALLALALWLWARAQALGPPLPLVAGDRRALLEHLHAAAEFAFRRGRGNDLLLPLRRRFLLRLGREQPALAALQGEARFHAIAERWRLDPAQVRRALAPPPELRADEFVAALRTFHLLRAKP